MKSTYRTVLGAGLLALSITGLAAESGRIGFSGHVADPNTPEGAALLQRQAMRDHADRLARRELPPMDSDAVFAARNLAGRQQGQGEIDAISFAYPVRNAHKTYDGYPAFLLHCDLQTGQCSDDAGQAIGSVETVAAKLPPVRNRDVLRRDWRCGALCVDATGTVVGSVQPEMTAWLKEHPSAKLR